MDEIKCGICRKHKAEYRDYRFIDSCGLQGKVLSCGHCRNLNDKEISIIVNDELDPEDEKEIMMHWIS